jgi:hypothetical protein
MKSPIQFIFGACGLALAALIGGVAAEDGAAPIRIYGGVFDKENKAPLPGANVFILEIKRGDVTDELGNFNITGLAAGRYTLVCRLLGYEETRRAVVVGEMNLKLDFYLKPNPIELGAVQIDANKDEHNLSEASQSLEILTQTELQKHRGQMLGETLKEIPGVTVLQTGPAVAKPVIRGDNLDANEPLFQIPADRLRLWTHWHLPDWGRLRNTFFELSGTLVKRQTRFPPFVFCHNKFFACTIFKEQHAFYFLLIIARQFGIGQRPASSAAP